MRSVLVEEAFAYGFTIAFWGSGVLLINEFGLLHTPGILTYAGGAVTGFGALAVVTFGGAVDTVEMESTPSYYVLAGIHYLAAFVPIVLVHLVIAAAFGKSITLFLAGALVSVCYNVFAVLEEALSELIWRIEQWYLADDTDRG